MLNLKLIKNGYVYQKILCCSIQEWRNKPNIIVNTYSLEEKIVRILNLTDYKSIGKKISHSVLDRQNCSEDEIKKVKIAEFLKAIYNFLKVFEKMIKNDMEFMKGNDANNWSVFTNNVKATIFDI